jgi:LacI family transcriptional regulator
VLGTQRLLAHGMPVTAIACYNDVTAIGALQVLRQTGYDVPRDVSVIGCDDIAAASWVTPTLTTMSQAKAEMGRLAVEHLLTAICDPERASAPATVRLAMSLIARGSTGPAPIQ